MTQEDDRTASFRTSETSRSPRRGRRHGELHVRRTTTRPGPGAGRSPTTWPTGLPPPRPAAPPPPTRSDGRRLQPSSWAPASSKTNYLWEPNASQPLLVREANGKDLLLRKYVYGSDLISMTTGDGWSRPESNRPRGLTFVVAFEYAARSGSPIMAMAPRATSTGVVLVKPWFAANSRQVTDTPYPRSPASRSEAYWVRLVISDGHEGPQKIQKVRGRHGLTPLTVESLRPSGSGWRRSLRLGRFQPGRQSTLCDGLSTAARVCEGDSGQAG